VRARAAVIPAAGLGTRFYPVTKAVPKELLPIVDVPALQIIMDEAIDAGCDHIVLVSSRAKPGLENYVTPDPAVVAKLRDLGRGAVADRLARIGTDVRVTITYQENPRGLGHAVGCAREAVGDEPFAVLLPDELRGDAGLLRLLIDSSEATGSSAIELKRVPMDEVSAYGVVSVAPGAPADGPFEITDVVEKPKKEDAPSDLIILGRYVLTPVHLGRHRRAEAAPERRAAADRCFALADGARADPRASHHHGALRHRDAVRLADRGDRHRTAPWRHRSAAARVAVRPAVAPPRQSARRKPPSSSITKPCSSTVAVASSPVAREV